MNDNTVVKNEISQEIKTIEKLNAADLGLLNEYRCTCGRLLGKFSGKAEIKCPKCGKVNVIDFHLDLIKTNG